MRMYDIIQNKKEGKRLSREEIEWFIQGYVNGDIPDYQASALAMAIYFKGMTDDEMADLTLAMRDSGDKADLSAFGGKTADKHSTGGVGDKTSLIVAPLAATLGCKVAKMSGRGLGHTGGTVDKLESIPGYQTTLDPALFRRQVEEIGVAVIGQSGNFAPADKKLYALRDVTATIDSIPMIASSIMSKKLAAGADHIVLDVKCGSGAFMKTPAEAKKLAEKMVAIGNAAGKKTAAIITDMDTPLGRGIGNAIEVKESVKVLQGSRDYDDLREVSLTLASLMVALTFGKTLEDAYKECEQALEDGRAYQTFLKWIEFQGGDIEVILHPEKHCPAAYSYKLVSPVDGYITHMDAEEIGSASVLLGAGRLKKEDSIDFSAGIVLEKKTGDLVKAGDCIATLYSSVTADFAPSAEKILAALSFGETPAAPVPLIFEIVQ